MPRGVEYFTSKSTLRYSLVLSLETLGQSPMSSAMHREDAWSLAEGRTDVCTMHARLSNSFYSLPNWIQYYGLTAYEKLCVVCNIWPISPLFYRWKWWINQLSWFVVSNNGRILPSQCFGAFLRRGWQSDFGWWHTPGLLVGGIWVNVPGRVSLHDVVAQQSNYSYNRRSIVLNFSSCIEEACNCKVMLDMNILRRTVPVSRTLMATGHYPNATVNHQ